MSYKIGGSLSPDSPSYVARQADQALYEAIQSGELCYVFNARQMGKSSLMTCAMQRLQAEGTAVCAALDLSIRQAVRRDEGQRTDSDSTEWYAERDKWYAGLSFSLASAPGLGLSNRFNFLEFRGWWQERELLDPAQRFKEFLETELFQHIEKRVVIFFDEVDSILDLGVRDEFFALLRSLYNKRAENSDYNRLVFVMLGVATPSNLIQGEDRTPFNIGHPIELCGFQFDEARPLLHGLSEKSTNPEVVLSEILGWTGGQPFLTQKLCKLVADSENFISEDDEAQAVEQLVKLHVLNNWEVQDEPVHLKTIRDRLLKDDQQSVRILGLYQQILQQGSIPFDSSSEHLELRLTGLVVNERGRLKCFNRIYAAIFSLDWIRQEIGKRRNPAYAAALEAWLISGCKSSKLLGSKDLQKAQAWAIGKSLSNEDYQFLAESQKKELRVFKRWRNRALREIQLFRRWRSRSAVIFAATIVGTAFTLALAWGTASVANKEKKEAVEEKAKAVEQEKRARATKVEATLETSYARFLTANANMEKEDAIEDFERTFARAEAESQRAEVASNRAEAESQRAEVASNRAKAESQRAEVASSRAKAESQRAEVASNQLDVAVQLTAIERKNAQALRQFRDGKEIEGLLLAMQTGQTVKTLTGFSDNYQIANSYRNTTSTLQKILDNAREKNQFSLPHDFNQAVNSSEDLKKLAIHTEGNVEIWSTDGYKLRAIEDNSYQFVDSQFSPDNEWLSIIGYSVEQGFASVFLYTSQGEEKFELKTNSEGVSAAFNPNSDQIVVAEIDGKISVYSLLNPDAPIKEFNVNPDGKLIYVSFNPVTEDIAVFECLEDNSLLEEGCKLEIWSKAGQKISEFPSPIRLFEFSPAGQELVTVKADGTIQFWDKYGQILKDDRDPILASSGTLYSLWFSPDGKLIGGMDRHGTRVWTVSGQLVAEIKNNRGEAGHLRFGSDSRSLITLEGNNSIVRFWDLTKDLEHQIRAHRDGVVAGFSPNGTLISSGAEGSIILRDLANSTDIYEEIEVDPGGANWINISLDGQWLAGGGAYNGVAQLWNITTGQHVESFPFQAHNDYTRINDITFSPDGKMFVTTGNDYVAKLWKIDEVIQTVSTSSTPEPEAVFEHNWWVWDADFISDQKIVTVGADGKAKIWDLAGNSINEFEVDEGIAYTVDYSPKTGLIATGGEEGVVRLWNESGSLRTEFEEVHQDRIWNLSFSRDESKLATASYDGTAKLWDITSGRILSELVLEKVKALSVSFSPDDSQIAVGASDGTIHLWESFNSSDIDSLLSRGCNWLDTYLIQNPQDLATLKECQTPERKKKASSTLIEQGRQLAERSEIDDAIDLFQQALQWNPDIDLNPTTEVKEQDPESVAENLSIPEQQRIDDLFEQAKYLVESRQIEEAFDIVLQIAEIEKSSNDVDFDSEIAAYTWIGDYLIDLGNLNEAVTQYQRAAELSLERGLEVDFDDPEVKAKEDAINELIERASSELQKGETDTAIQTYIQAGELFLELNPERDIDLEISAYDWAGDRFVALGDVDEAIEQYRHAAELSLERGLEVDFDDPEVKAKEDVINELSSYAIRELENGAIETAIKTYIQAGELFQELNPDISIDLEIGAYEWAGDHFITLGEVDKAIEQYRQVAELILERSSEPRFDNPEVEARRIAANQLVTEGINLAKEGSIESAVMAIDQAQITYPEGEIKANLMEKICRYGSLHGFADSVLAICEEAVEADSENNGLIQDSRGIARALTGNALGAIADFEAFIAWSDDERLRQQRRDWITSLEVGQNPFTSEVLQILLDELESSEKN